MRRPGRCVGSAPTSGYKSVLVRSFGTHKMKFLILPFLLEIASQAPSDPNYISDYNAFLRELEAAQQEALAKVRLRNNFKKGSKKLLTKN